MQGFIFAGISGILLTLGYAPYSQAWLGWVALAPFVFYFLTQKESSWNAFRLGYFLGLIHFLTSLFWLTNVSWLGWFILCLYLAVYPALWALLWNWRITPLPRTLHSIEILRHAVFGAFSWCVLEWVKGWLFTGFPWNMLGVTQHAVLPIIQIADLGGVSLISWLLVFSNLVFAQHARRIQFELKGIQPLRLRLDLIVVIIFMGLCFAYGVQRIYEKHPVKARLNYLAVQPAIPQNPWDSAPVLDTLNQIKEITFKGSQNADIPLHLVLWPETPIAASVFTHPAFSSTVRGVTQITNTPLMLGSNDHVFTKVYNAAVLVQNDSAQIYHKRHLVPMGEYVPLSKIFPFLRRFVPPGIDFSSGEKPEIFHLENLNIKIAPLICFEDTLSNLVRDTLSLNPDLFVNLTNDGWFGHSSAAQQHLNNAIFRAVEFRKPMIRVTNNGMTAAITEKGIPQIPFSKNPHISAYFTSSIDVPEINSSTIYAQWGDWIPKMGIIFLLIVFVAEHKNISKVFSRKNES